jgi:hypothetical protein
VFRRRRQKEEPDREMNPALLKQLSPASPQLFGTIVTLALLPCLERNNL